jgi:predicted RNA binding protein YcfA (HicA-like mRNA interferase family)
MAQMQELIKLITGDGWQIITLRGPHWQFVHPSKPGRITISAHLDHEVGQGTLKSIIRQANVSLKEGKQHGRLLSRH